MTAFDYVWAVLLGLGGYVAIYTLGDAARRWLVEYRRHRRGDGKGTDRVEN